MGDIVIMNNLKEVFINEIPAFRELGHKFLNKEVSTGDFKSASEIGRAHV